MIIASSSKAAGVSKNIGNARLHEYEPHAEKKQRERDPPHKNRGSRQETGGKGMQYFHTFSLHLLTASAPPGTRNHPHAAHPARWRHFG
jgi:hypothetical protein